MNPIVVTILVKEKQADFIREAQRRQLANGRQRKRSSSLHRFAVRLQALLRPNHSQNGYQQPDTVKLPAGCN